MPGVTDFNSEEMSAPSYALMDISGAVHPDALAYQKPYMRVYPASITKLMTALVCLQNVRDLEQEFTVTENSVIRDSGSSLAQLHPGDRISIRNLLYGMLLPSGNDAAVAVAEATAGSIPRFVVMMNEEALRLGCTGTHFVNPHGLPDDNHFTTAYDIYLILREVMKYDEFRDIVSKRDYSVSYQDKNGHVRTQKWEISNRYLLGEEEIPGGLSMLGGKTGTTLKAGYCLALAVRKDDSGKEYISIVMKSKTKDELYQNMSALLEKIH